MIRTFLTPRSVLDLSHQPNDSLPAQPSHQN